MIYGCPDEKVAEGFFKDGASIVPDKKKMTK
mgnify:CR=1 FL=1